MWTGEFKGHTRTFSKQELVEISSALAACNSMRPIELHRSIRSFDHLSDWKGTEYRTLLLYVGIIILKKYLSTAEYKMFLNLFCAVTICSAKAYEQHLHVARKLFVDFIEDHIDVYGEDSITINIHNTSHVVDDVEMFGPLHTISAYEFENSLHHLKLRLKPCNKPLQQIDRRISELDSVAKVTNLTPEHSYPRCKYPFYIQNAVAGLMNSQIMAYRHVEYKQNATLSSKNANGKDKWFLTHDNIIVAFHFISKEHGSYILHGSALENTENFFSKAPLDSKYLNIFLSNGELQDPSDFQLNSIKAKMFCVPYENNYVFLPLLHTL